MRKLHRTAAAALSTVLVLALPAAALGGPAVRVTGRTVEAAPAAPDLPAVTLRVALDQMLGEHALLTMQAMRTGVAGGADFPAAGEALEGNTRDLQDAIKSIYGPAAAKAFGEIWRPHIGYVVDYTRAVSSGDEAAKKRAVNGLADYRKKFSAFLAGANPKLPQSIASDLLGEHITQLEHLAKFVERDYAAAYVESRHVYEHMFTLGDNLAFAITAQFPKKFRGDDVAHSPATSLRVALDRLLGEHAFLAVDAMRAGATGGAGFPAAVQALESNSADLQTAIQSIYGAPAADRFGELWRNHTGFYVDYIRAVAAGDKAGKAAALEGLKTYTRDFSAFLAGANPNLEAGAVEKLIREHSLGLAKQVDQYSARDYGAAYTTARQTFSHMFTISAALGTAIARQFPDKFPGLPETSTAPATVPSGTVPPWLPLGPLGLGLLGLVGLLGRVARRGARSG